MRLLRQQDHGSAIVEFAITSAVVLAVLFGIIDAGRALYAYNWTSNAARKGTRFMIVRGEFCVQDPMPLTGGCPATAQNLDDYIKNTGGNGLDTTGIDTNKITTTASCFAPAGARQPPPCAAGGWVRVNVTYTFNFITPFLRVIPAWNMTSYSQVIVQN
ncbi:MAG TPA: TadE family protein [Terriglobales bacterium]|nr:TadE family protein [Terriglobales bacterium]